MTKFRICAVILAALILTLGGTAVNAAAHPDQEIRYAEFIQPWDSAAIAPAVAGGHAIWSFDALGESFDIELTSNARLIENMPAARQAELLADNTLLRGTLLDNPDSWVRMSETAAGGINGMIWNGGELFVIEPGLAVESQFVFDSPLARNDNRLAIFRYADLVHPDFDCGAPGHDIVRSDEQPLANPDANVGIFGVLDVIVVEDQSWGGDTLGLFNTVDGIYAGQIGANVSIFSTESANLFPSPPVSNTYLDLFDDYLGNRATIGAGHLMSGRGDTGWAGIAYIRQLCTNRSHGISVDFGFTSTVTILAHELGHNSDALHDGDVGCSGGFIMDAFVSGSQTFSSCSVGDMVPYMSGRSCITNNNPPGGDGFCFDFSDFCDGLQVSASGGVVSGTWENFDCAGSNAPVTGSVSPSEGEIICDGNGACNVSPGDVFSFIIDRPLDNTMDMFLDGGIFIDDLSYGFSSGNCAFAQGGGVPSIGAAQ